MGLVRFVFQITVLLSPPAMEMMFAEEQERGDQLSDQMSDQINGVMN